MVFMTGVALPLMVKEFHLTAADKGMISAASLAGILIGATALGGLADHFGRKMLFISEMVLFTIFLVLVAVSPSFPLLVLSLFGMGLALGCDYPTAHLVISESIPSHCRGKLVLGAFGFQAVGRTGRHGARLFHSLDLQVPGRLASDVCLRDHPGHRGDHRAAVHHTEPALADEQGPAQGRRARNAPPAGAQTAISEGYRAGAGRGAALQATKTPEFTKLFTKPKYRRATILASVPWFLQDLSTYGIGIFTPTILAYTFGHDSGIPRNLADIIHDDIQAAKGQPSSTCC